MEQSILSEFDLDLSTVSIPKYIAIEGPIGIGKTTLAKRLASSFNYETMLEDAEENPFLERFYQDRRGNALPTQLFFLFNGFVNWKPCDRVIFFRKCASRIF